MGTVSSKRGSMEVRRQKDELPPPPATIAKTDDIETPMHKCSPPLINYVSKDVNQRDEHGRTNLHNALLHGADNECIIVQLIRMGCDPNTSDDLGLKPLHVAAARGYSGCLAKLLAAKVEIDPVDNEGHTPAMLACQANQAGTATLLFNRGAQLNAETKSGRTALHLASASGANECVPLLLERKAKPNIRDKDGNTALMLACHYDNAECARILTKRGAKANTVNKEGRTAVHLAANSGSTECIKVLIDAQADLDVQDNNGQTPCVCAIMANEARVLKLLLDGGCDSTAIDGLNGTALALATCQNALACVRVLLDHGTNPDEFGFSGMTPLMTAVYKAKVPMVDLLLDYDADPNVVSRNGTTALLKGIKCVTAQSESDSYRSLVLLLRANANVNQDITLTGLFANFCPMGRQCPMALAVATGVLAVVRMLAIAGSDINYFNVSYWSMRNMFTGSHACYNTSLGQIEEVRRFLEEWTLSPHPLSHLCRKVIRRNLTGKSKTFKKNLRKLPVPDGILRYLNFVELDQFLNHTADVSSRTYVPGMGNHICTM